MIKGKKGFTLSFGWLMYIPRVVFLILVISTQLWLIYSFIITNLDVSEAEAHLLMHTMQYAPDGFLKLGLDEKEMAAKFVVHDVIEDTDEVTYINEDTYETWLPIARFVIQERKGSVTPHREVRYMSIDGQPSQLETVIITKND